MIVLVHFFSLIYSGGEGETETTPGEKSAAAIMCCEASFASSDSEHIHTARWLNSRGTGPKGVQIIWWQEKIVKKLDKKCVEKVA